jgi:hypothetical protein
MNQFSEQETEVLIAFCNWQIRHCSGNPKLQKDLTFWQTLKTKFEQCDAKRT